MEMRTALGRVRGLGSAREGAAHWWAQRLTGLALVPLGLWFVVVAISLVGADLAAFRAWIGNLGNATLMVLFIIALFHHAQLGVQVIIEDYVHGEGMNLAGIVLTKAVVWLCGTSSVYAVLKVALGS